jgi:hypothetical protein
MQFSQVDFPNLHAGNQRETEKADDQYNCIAWAVGRTGEWWDHAQGVPGKKYYWPPNAPKDYKTTSLIVAFDSEGFVICADGSLESGIEKIVIYADGPEYTHAARQLETGNWSSKMGGLRAHRT